MIAVAVMVALQGARPTVGDTVWIARAVSLPSGQILRPQTWDLGDIGMTLGAPEVDYRPDSATVRYPIVLWFPGVHKLTIPGPIIVSPAGSSDTLPGSEVTVEVASVLPANRPKAELAPRGPAPLLPQSDRSLLPVAVFLGLVAIAATGAWWWWQVADRRRRRRLAPPAPVSEPPLARILDGWAASGEVRIALEGWAHLVERRLSADPNSERREEAEALLVEMNAAGFRPDPATGDAEALIGRARSVVVGPAAGGA